MRPLLLTFLVTLFATVVLYVLFYTNSLRRAYVAAGFATPEQINAGTCPPPAACPAAKPCPVCPTESQAQTAAREMEASLASVTISTTEATTDAPAPIPAVVEGDDSDGPAWQVTSSLECGRIVSKPQHWSRKVCVKLIQPTPTGTTSQPPLPPTVQLQVDIEKTDLESKAKKRVCGDSLRAILYCDTARVAPFLYEEIPGKCGVHTMHLTVPPGTCDYKLELRVVHVEGEGMEEPPFPMPFPTNIGGNESLRYIGPLVVNADAGIPGTLNVRPNVAALSKFRYHALPQCKNTVGGYWVRPANLDLAPFFPHAWEWRGHDCRYELYTSIRLRKCLQTGRRTLFMGESTLEAVKDAFFKHYRCDASCSQWPEVVHSGETTVDKFAKWTITGSCHGLDECLRRDQPWPELANTQKGEFPNVFVVGEGANDMMRDTFDSWRANLREFSDRLEKANWRGKLVWVTAPTRNYKSTGAEMQCSCHGSERQRQPQCLCGSLQGVLGQMRESHKGLFASVEPRTKLDEPVYHMVHEVTMPRFFNTFERTREANRIAIEHFRNTLPEDRFIFVDMHAITEALDAMYCIDGVHYHCDKRDFVDRKMLASMPCRGLGNAVAANALANAICHGSTD